MISPQTHGKYLALICNDLPVDLQLYRRFVKFLNTVTSSTNRCINLCGRLVLNGSNSIVCKNLNKIAYDLSCDRSILAVNYNLFYNKMCLKRNLLYTHNDFITANNINDILHIRDVKNTCFKRDELNLMLKYLCEN